MKSSLHTTEQMIATASDEVVFFYEGVMWDASDETPLLDETLGEIIADGLEGLEAGKAEVESTPTGTLPPIPERDYSLEEIVHRWNETRIEDPWEYITYDDKTPYVPRPPRSLRSARSNHILSVCSRRGRIPYPRIRR